MLRRCFPWSWLSTPSALARKTNGVAAAALNRCSLSTSVPRLGLEEFFPDLKLNPNERNRSGRPWSVADLRLKSDTDLHKLWYVLLKERNMLGTLKWSARRLRVEMPGMERIDKVQESMDNIREVLIERDSAYRQADEEIRNTSATLETSLAVPSHEHGEEPWYVLEDVRGMSDDRLREYREKRLKEARLDLIKTSPSVHSPKAMWKKKRARFRFVRRRYPRYLSTSSPWVRPSMKRRRHKLKQVSKTFFVSNKRPFSVRR